MSRLVRLSALLLLLVLLAGCAARERDKVLDETLKHYAALIRWNEYAAAADYYDPKLRQSDPISALELRRLSQFKVSGYEPRSFQESPDGLGARQSVEIRLYNVHTQTERVLLDRQTWRYDESAERWWLTSGLPDVTASR